MVVALLAALLLGSSSGTSSILAAFDDAQAAVKAQIEDRDRRTQLLSGIDRAARAMKEALKGRGKATGELVALLRSHEGTSADMEPVVQRLRAEAEAAQEQIIRYRFEVKGKMSREEWSKVFPQR